MLKKITKNKTAAGSDLEARYWYALLPWLFLLLALPANYFIWQSAKKVEFAEKDTAFQQQLNDASSQLTSQMSTYEQAMYGLRSLFDASEFVTEQEFKLFANEMLNSNHSTGLHQVGFAKLVAPLRPQTYRRLASKHQKAIMRLNPQSLHAPIIYVAAKRTSNYQTPAFMTDAFKQKKIKEDMESTARHNSMLMTDPIGLENTAYEDCLSMVLTIYTEAVNNQSLSGMVDREVYGWVFVNLNLHAIYETVFSHSHQPEISFALYNRSNTGAPQLLFENVPVNHHQSAFSGERTFVLYGQQWVLSASSLARFESKLDYSYSNKVGVLGLFITAALLSIFFLLVGRLRTFDHLKQANHLLKLSDERWYFALEGSGDGVWDWDIENNYVEYSKRWRQIFGFEVDELEGTFSEWEAKVHPDEQHLVTSALQAYLDGKSKNYSIEYRLKCKDGSWKWILSRGMVVSRNAENKPSRMVGTHTDISQLKESEEQIWQHANVDYLTDLPNRRMLYAQLDREIDNAKRSGTKLALLFLDLDGFKEVNDTLGHDQGDVLLQQAGERLTQNTFASDVVARLGGDEFVVLISNIKEGNINSVERVAQKVLGAMADPFTLKHETAFVTASIGIAIYPDDSTSIDGLIKNVDQAMYASKNRGGNCFTYFTPQMQEKAMHRLRLSNDLRQALEKEELSIEYQPIVALSTGEIYKAEALLRWNHPERGFISPAEFIPIAEDTRLINEIGYWVFMEAIKQCKAWREVIDERFQIAVNKSAVQFMSAELKYTDWVNALPTELDQSSTIVVEITESILLEASEYVGARLLEYRSKGVQIALDDFGTGYSSLSYLREFDFDYLKIDKSFVANLEKSEEDRVLCKAIIVMAHSLGIEVVAEGIETRRQRDVLVEAGCDYGQGWYFSKSLPPSTFEKYVKNKV